MRVVEKWLEGEGVYCNLRFESCTSCRVGITCRNMKAELFDGYHSSLPAPPPASEVAATLTSEATASPPAAVKLRGAPERAAGQLFTNEAQKAALLVRAEKVELLLAAAARVSGLRERAGDLLQAPDTAVLSTACRLTVHERSALTKSTSPYKGALAECLMRRSRKALKVPSEQPMRVLSSEGSHMAISLPVNSISAEEAVVGWEELRKLHAQWSTGWAFGCEADLPPDFERISAGLCNAKHCAGLKVVQGFTVHGVGHRNGNTCVLLSPSLPSPSPSPSPDPSPTVAGPMGLSWTTPTGRAGASQIYR